VLAVVIGRREKSEIRSVPLREDEEGLCEIWTPRLLLLPVLSKREYCRVEEQLEGKGISRTRNIGRFVLYANSNFFLSSWKG
jgi:hypothetical protein